MTVREVGLNASTHGKAPTRLRARIAEYDRGDRIRRGFRRFLPIFGCACLVVLIPPHVPWFTIVSITAIVLGLQTYRQTREVLEVDGTCPDCAKVQSFALPPQLPAIQRCAECGAFLKLEEAA